MGIFVGSGQRSGIWVGGAPGRHYAPAPDPVTPPPGPSSNRPVNAGLICYDSTAGTASAWAHPGALVVAGRTNYNDSAFHTIAAGGGTVIIYLHMGLMNTVGRYHDMLYNSSQFGGAVPGWPGGPWVVDEYGNLADFRPGSLLNSKLPGLLALMLSENPHISGFFFDGLGTRGTPGTGGFSWASFPDKELYRAGAIEQAQIFRSLADSNNLFALANSNWQAGDIASTQGGGYPDRMKHGCSLVDGGFIEEHATIDAFWTNYCNSPQWGSATPRNKSYMWASIINNTTARDNWVNANLVAYASSSGYSVGVPTPWRGFTNFGIPHR